MGEKAPEIKITNWIHNIPNDLNLEKKYIVLDFWSTRCKPCIESFPHLNELKEKNNRDDLYFISITDESIEKVKKLISIVDIYSIIVSDKTGITQKKFGDGIKGLEYIPLTVLIDNNNIVKWIGNPKSLNDKIIFDFINNQLEIIETKKFESRLDNSKNIESQTFDDYLNIINNDTIKYFFSLRETYNNLILPQVKVGKKMFYLESINFLDILKYVLDYNDKEIIINDSEIKSKNYKFIYKNDSLINKNNKNLEIEILNELSLVKQKVVKRTIVNEIKILKKNNLEFSTDKLSSITKAKGRAIYSGFSIDKLLVEINKYSDDYYSYSDLDKKSYNFVIDLNSSESIRASLESYGLKILQKEREIEAYNFTKIN